MTTEPDSLRQVAERWGIHESDDHPEEWLHADVEVTDLGKGAPSPSIMSDLVTAATRTSRAAIEVWGPAGDDETWPYLVMPWVDFETMGPCVAPGKNRVTFGGFLFDRDWGWHSDPPTESNGLQVPFAPLLEVGEGACGPWATPTFPRRRPYRAVNGPGSSNGPRGRATSPGALPSPAPNW